MPSVGVAIVTHNSATHISSCLLSLPASAPGIPMRVVLVDNHSADGTVAVARAARPDLDVIEHPENVGFARAVNAAASVLADCPYLLLLNPDTIMEAGSLTSLLVALSGFPKAAACGPHLLYPDGQHQISARPLPTLAGTIYDALLLYHLKRRPDFVEQFPKDLNPMEVDCLSGACMLIHRGWFDALHGLDEQFFLYGEDVDFCRRLHENGRTMLLVPVARVSHVEGASAFQDRGLFFQEIHRARALYARKHFGAVESMCAIVAQVTGLAARGVLYTFGPALGRPDLRVEAPHQWKAIRTVLGRRPPQRGGE